MRYKPKKTNKIAVIISDDNFFNKTQQKLIPLLIGYKVKVFNNFLDSLDFFNCAEADKCFLVFIKYKSKCIEQLQQIYLLLKRKLKSKLKKNIVFILALDRKETFTITNQWAKKEQRCIVINTPIHRNKLSFIMAEKLFTNYAIA